MPIIHAHLLEGYDESEKNRLARALTDAVRQVIPAKPDAITVMLHESPAANYMRGGESRSPAPARPDPVAIVKDYLAAMEAREIERAKSHLAPDFAMIFPATEPMHTLEELIAWAKPRYKFVRKTYDGYDLSQDGERTVVYCRGTLYGEWPDGSPFSGIRFIDRFEIIGGKISRQDVWNDIAETKAQS